MKKKPIIVLIIIISIFSCVFSYTPLGVKADSGFDSSYDSGGFDSGWSSDSSYSSYSSSSSSDGEDLIAVIIFFVIIIALIIIVNRNSQTQTTMYLDHTKEVADDIVKQYIENFERIPFLRERYNDYLKVQEDWMNFNYDGLRESLSDELYNQYEMQLDTLKVKNEKNIMKNFNYIDSMITAIDEINGEITITVELLVKFIDYIEQNGRAVRGNSSIQIIQHYALTFKISKTSLKECPNCGAPLNNNATQKCEYCGSIITKSGTKCILSKKESLRQR